MNDTAISTVNINYDTSVITATLITGETLTLTINYIPATGSDEVVAISETRGYLCKTALITDINRALSSLSARVSLP